MKKKIIKIIIKISELTVVKILIDMIERGIDYI